MILRVYQKSLPYEVRFLRCGLRQTYFFVILGHFLPFCSPMDPENQNFETVKKNAWRYYHFTKMYHEWQSYDVWFLRYGARRTFWTISFWTVFFPPNPPPQPPKSKFWKMKKHLEISCYTNAPKIMIICYFF